MRTPLTPLTALSPPQFVPRSGIARLSVASTGPLVAAGARVGPYVVGKALGSGHYAEVFEATERRTVPRREGGASGVRAERGVRMPLTADRAAAISIIWISSFAR